MMSAGEVCRDFRLAKDRRKQIRILAQRNLVSEACIALILFEHGEIQKTPEKTTLVKALDVLETCISGAEKKLDALYRLYHSVADFLEQESAEMERKERKMAKRNCRRTPEEKRIHDQAVKLRNMTDAQLVRAFENMRDLLRIKEKEGADRDGSLEAFLSSLSEPGVVRGIGQATVDKLRRYAKEGGFLEKQKETDGRTESKCCRRNKG